MTLLPERLITGIKNFSDLSVGMYGMQCDLYIPTNLSALATTDIYMAPTDIVFKKYTNHRVWIEWFAKDIQRLRTLGLYTESDAPIKAWFPEIPEVCIKSYIVLDIKYVPEKYDTDRFEIVDVLSRNTYNAEVFRVFKLAPLRLKV
jgi:hypothetical protein